MTDRVFARGPLRAPTIYLALPFLCARWAEPHCLTSYRLMPARHGGTLEVQGLRGAGGVRFFSDQAYLDRSDARKTVLLLRSRHPFKIDNDGGSNERR